MTRLRIYVRNGGCSLRQYLECGEMVRLRRCLLLLGRIRHVSVAERRFFVVKFAYAFEAECFNSLGNALTPESLEHFRNNELTWDFIM